MMRGYVWIQSTGSIVPADEAVLPFAAPAVLYGETLFETLRMRQKKLFRMADHLDRLKQGVAALGWCDNYRPDDLVEGLRALVKSGRCDGHDMRIRITVVRLDDAGAIDCYIMATPYDPPANSLYARGVSAHIASPRIAAENPWMQSKTGQRFAYRFARDEASRQGAWEGLLLNTDGYIADGSITNVHFVRDDTVCTPGSACGALPGIAQAVVREIAAQSGFAWQTGAYRPMDLLDANEAFLTNSLVGIVPLVTVDGRSIGEGTPGVLTQKLHAAYQEKVRSESVSLQ